METMNTNERLVVLGAGNWGTALARLYAPLRPTLLVTRTHVHAAELKRHGENRRYLPGHPLPRELEICALSRLELRGGDAALLAVPSHRLRELVGSFRGELNGTPVINASKGFEFDTLKTMSEVLAELLPDSDIVALSGPNIAGEIAKGLPARAVLAGKRLDALSRAVRYLKNDTLIYETSRDLRGVEISASLKGMLAIAVGLADGLGLGDNFTGLLMAYGLREFVTLATFMGSDESTVYGIAGLGDMVTSSLSPSGRNRRFGRYLAEGDTLEQALAKVGMVVEGVQMLKVTTRLEELNLPLPLFSTVHSIVFGAPPNPGELLVETVRHYGAPLRSGGHALPGNWVGKRSGAQTVGLSR